MGIRLYKYKIIIVHNLYVPIVSNPVVIVGVPWNSHTRHFPLAEFIRGLGVT
jgi:hypothetical protein